MTQEKRTAAQIAPPFRFAAYTYFKTAKYGVLVDRDLEEVRGALSKCTRGGLCKGARGQVMRFASAQEDARAKDFSLPGEHCGTHLLGGFNSASIINLDGISAGSIFDNDAFLYWELDPGPHDVVLYPGPLSLSLDCEAGQLNFVHYRHLTSPGWLRLEVQAEGQRAIQERKLAIPGPRALSSMTWKQIFNTEAARDAEVASSSPDEPATIFILKRGNDERILAVDGYYLSWMEEPNHFLQLEAQAGRHTVIAATLRSDSSSMITIDVEAGQNYYLALSDWSSRAETGGGWALRDSSSGPGLLKAAEMEPQDIAVRSYYQVMPRSAIGQQSSNRYQCNSADGRRCAEEEGCCGAARNKGMQVCLVHCDWCPV